jgi:acyl transferase domain-containing protein
LANKREIISHRAFVIANGKDMWDTSSILQAGDRAPPRTVFVFSRQGAQYAMMGKSLINQVLKFRDSISGMDYALRSGSHPPKWTLLEEILRPKKTSHLSEAEFSQPCTTAIQIALVDLLSSNGIRAEAVIGHSSGEIAAVYAARSLSSTDAITTAYQRGHVLALSASAEVGGMAAVGLGWEDVEPFLAPGVVVGCENIPESVTLSGDKDTLDSVLGDIRMAHSGILARALHVDRAYHSHHMQAIADQHLQSLPRSM